WRASHSGSTSVSLVADIFLRASGTLALRLPLLQRFADQPSDNLFGVEAFGLRGKRGDYTVREYRHRNVQNIFQTHHVAAVQCRAGLGTENQILHGSYMVR